MNTTDDSSDVNLGDGVCATASGECSLRAAIEELNALGVDPTPHEIHFAIPGSSPYIIALLTPLPTITVPLVIDGSTQPGSACPMAVRRPTCAL